MPDPTIDRRIAELLEPEPGPTRGGGNSLHLFSPLGLWINYWGDNPEGEWRPQEFTQSRDAFHLAWARLTDWQKDRVAFVAMDGRAFRDTEPTWVQAIDAEPIDLCRWLLAALEGK